MEDFGLLMPGRTRGCQTFVQRSYVVYVASLVHHWYSHSPLMSGGSTIQSEFLLSVVAVLNGWRAVSNFSLWLLSLQLFKNGNDIQGKLRFNLPSFSVIQLLRYARWTVFFLVTYSEISCSFRNTLREKIAQNIWTLYLALILVFPASVPYYVVQPRQLLDWLRRCCDSPA